MAEMAATSGGRVAIIGASGYGGLQTIRLLQGHPSFSVTYLGGERSAGRRWSSICSFLPLPDDPFVESVDQFESLKLPTMPFLACPMVWPVS